MTDYPSPSTFATSAGGGPRKPRGGPAQRLRNALIELTGGLGRLDWHKEKAWASITFTGTRHTIRLTCQGSDAVEAGELFIAQLPEHEFALPGQLVAEATITSVEHTVLPDPYMQIECEILVLNDE